ncbi:MAG: imidazole glycerol phosphate synthase subunit HisH [Rhodocyclaceae bacterium]|nr:imidazole glycerol phosphate synthase subunit HisH [Rhodocyclaceae bacterium]
MQKLVVVDYGMGNLRSVARAFEFASREWEIPTRVLISEKPQDVCLADKVVFPGQGAMPDCMRYLRESGLEDAVRDAAANKPFFGVCVGMQMLFDISEEGNTPGLGIFSGGVEKFRPADATLKVPHMGWNQVDFAPDNPVTSALFNGIPSGERFYFVHSYYCAPSDPSIVVATTDYSGRFTAAVGRANIFATQFHPEKSHHAGLTVYKNFLKLNL